MFFNIVNSFVRKKVYLVSYLFAYFKMLKSLQIAEVYLEPKRASTMERFYVNLLNSLLFS